MKMWDGRVASQRWLCFPCVWYRRLDSASSQSSYSAPAVDSILGRPEDDALMTPAMDNKA